jgi:hypothetical protein
MSNLLKTLDEMTRVSFNLIRILSLTSIAVILLGEFADHLYFIRLERLVFAISHISYLIYAKKRIMLNLCLKISF